MKSRAKSLESRARTWHSNVSTSGSGLWTLDSRLSSRGFTLLEVLISLAIVAMMAVVLGSAYINILNSYGMLARDHSNDEEVRFARTALLATTDIQKAQDGDEFDSTGD